MAHTRIRKFNTSDTYPEQNLDTAVSIGTGDPAAQTHQAMRNIKMLLEESGARMEHICWIVIYLTDIRYREAVYRTIGESIKGVHPVSTGLYWSAIDHSEPKYRAEDTTSLGRSGRVRPLAPLAATLLVLMHRPKHQIHIWLGRCKTNSRVR